MIYYIIMVKSAEMIKYKIMVKSPINDLLYVNGEMDIFLYYKETVIVKDPPHHHPHQNQFLLPCYHIKKEMPTPLISII